MRLLIFLNSIVTFAIKKLAIYMKLYIYTSLSLNRFYKISVIRSINIKVNITKRLKLLNSTINQKIIFFLSILKERF